MYKYRPRKRIYKTGKRMASLKEETRALNPVAAAVEDAGGIRMYKNGYLREQYHLFPLRYRRMGGRPLDLLLEDVRCVMNVNSIEDVAESLIKDRSKTISEDDYYLHKYEETVETIPF
jgi:hypothetical protein